MITAPAPSPWGIRAPGRGASVLDAVADLRRDVARTELLLDVPGAAHARDLRGRLLDQLDDHLLPRLRAVSTPAVVVVAGSTGAGKSTLVNSVVGREVTTAGLLRPTTRRPVLVHHAADGELLAGHPLLDVVDVAEDDAVPRGLSLLDAPDLDSVLAENRLTAHRLLEAADLWLFVTTAARYGDALPWSVLDRAAERGTSIAVVLNRVPREALVDVRGDLLRRLRERGMTSVPLFVVPDVGPHEGLLEASTVAPVRRWLAMVAGPDRARSVIARTQRGSLRALRPWVDDLAEAVQEQVDARAALDRLLDEAQRGPAEAAVQAARSGSVVDGPVRGRWQALAGAGPLGGRWPSRRGGARRVEALGVVREELADALVRVLAGARRRGRAAVEHALEVSALPGATDVLAALEDPDVEGAAAATVRTAVPAPEDAARTWLSEADAAADLLGSGAGRRLAELGPGAGTVVAVAAAGLGAARTALVQVAGRDAEAALEPLADALATRVAAQTRAGADAARAVLDVEALADDAASRLRLRLAVLKDVA